MELAVKYYAVELATARRKWTVTLCTALGQEAAERRARVGLMLSLLKQGKLQNPDKLRVTSSREITREQHVG